MRNPEATAGILAHLSKALAGSLSSMTGKEFSIAEEKSENPELEQPIIWQQSFSFAPEPTLWVAAGKDLWAAAGQLTLAAVGIDSLTDEDCRSTWQEIAGQTIGSFASAVTADIQHEITSAKGEEIPAAPDDLVWTVLAATYQGGPVAYLKVAWSAALVELYDHPEPAPRPASGGKDSIFSKTFDLLLDVALPVNVSFGRTSLQIREVLKLNTGSIIELNRFVAEPVEVIVNDCIIARGEVVVVDGNYGVRITHLASREDRMRFGMADTSSRIGAPAR